LLGKLSNSRTVINRALRDHEDKISDSDKLEQMSDNLRRAIDNVFNTGNEMYCEVWKAMLQFLILASLIMILNHKEKFFMTERNRVAPRDKINCLLPFAYILLVHDVLSALEEVGLDPQAGFCIFGFGYNGGMRYDNG
jgi:CRISPR-associated protein Cas1